MGSKMIHQSLNKKSSPIKGCKYIQKEGIFMSEQDPRSRPQQTPRPTPRPQQTPRQTPDTYRDNGHANTPTHTPVRPPRNQ